MNDGIRFTVEGAPRGKGRGKPVPRGKFAQIITDDATLAYQNRVSYAAAAAMARAGLDAPMEGPLELRLLIRILAPKASKTKREKMINGLIKPARKPDTSNVLKAVEDGCNHVAWRDDSQITYLAVRKVYAENPGVDVVIHVDHFTWPPLAVNP
jgi:Holliday junction resolvase RusA-like endonuclease